MTLIKNNFIKWLVVLVLIALLLLILKLSCPAWINAQPSPDILSEKLSLPKTIIREIKETAKVFLYRDLYIGIFCPNTIIAQ